MSTRPVNVVSAEDAKAKVNDVVIVGNGNLFQLLCKASSESQGWMKSSKAMEIPGLGCVVQSTTREKGERPAEAMVFVPDCRIEPDVNGGRKIVFGVRHE